MMTSYRFLSAAESEAAEAILFYNEVSSEVGNDFVSHLDRAIRLLCSLPKIGSPIEHGFRSFPLRKFPFSIIYKSTDDEIVIIAVAHHSRRPGYWKSRFST